MHIGFDRGASIAWTRVHTIFIKRRASKGHPMKIDGLHVASQEGVDLHRMALINSRSTALKAIRGLILTWQWRSNDGNPMLARSWIMRTWIMEIVRTMG